MKLLSKNKILIYICALTLAMACFVCAPNVYADEVSTPESTEQTVDDTQNTDNQTTSSDEVVALSQAASDFVVLVNAIDQTNAEEVANTYVSLLAQSLSENQPEDLEDQFANAEIDFDAIATQIQQAQDTYDALSEEDKNEPEVVAAFTSLSSLATTIQAMINSVYNESPVSLPAPMATGIHFTQLEIHEKLDDGSVGPLVADLMTSTNITLENGVEYYFIGSAKKDHSSDDTWMSMSFPWYIQPKIMPGGTGVWNVTGSAVTDGITFDKVEDYTAVTSPTSSAAAPTDAGTVRYHIMNGTGGSAPVVDAAFQISFEVVPNYFDGNGSGQNWTANKFTFAVGDEASTTTPLDTISTGTTTITGAQTVAGEITKSPNVNLGVAAASTNSFTVSNGGEPMVWTNIECDLVYPTAYNPTISALTYGGVTLTAGASTIEGTNTVVHYSGNVPTGKVDAGFSCTSSFPTVEEVKRMTIKDIKITPYEDENTNRVVTGSAQLKWNISNAPAAVGLAGMSMTRYDWYGQEDIKANTLIGEVNITNTPASSSNNPYTVKITTATNAVVREVAVPYWEGHGDTVIINGTTYNIADVAVIDRRFSYYEYVATITTEKLGWDEDTSIETVEWEMGKVPGHYQSYGLMDSPDRPSDWTTENHLSVYGSILDGANATSKFEIYETATGPTGASYQTADGIGIPTDLKYIPYSSDSNVVKIGGTGTQISGGGSCQAGNSLDIVIAGYVDPWVDYREYGKYSATDYDPAFYIIVPVGMGLKESSVTLNGDSVTPVDVTANAANVPTGVKIYQVKYPTEGVNGSYKPDSTSIGAGLKFTLNTAPSGTTTTYRLQDIVQVGTNPDAIANGFTASYSGHWNTVAMPNAYNLNSTDPNTTLVGFKTTFDLTPTAGIIVNNSLIGTSKTNPLNTELVYDSTNPTATRLEVDNGYAATYKVEITNRIGSPAENLMVFIPIPKEDQNFGSAFNPNGAQQFDVTFTDKTIPTGWTSTYVKMNPGFTSVKNTRINTALGASYTEVSDPADADMVILTAPTPFADASTVTVEFNVSSDDLSANNGDINTWYCMTQYDVGSTLNAASLFQESMIVNASAPTPTPTPTPTPNVTPNVTPTPGPWLVTYVDCNGNTVKVEWVGDGYNSTKPNANYSDVNNVHFNYTAYPNNCGVGYKVPNTGVKDNMWMYYILGGITLLGAIILINKTKKKA